MTVLFCDVVGSTALGESVDPEALQGLLARYFERMSGIVEAHGGTVEKFIGDAVMAVFGVPVAHEDDALRACRAAVEMRDALPELGVEGRIGVNTGEVLTGTEERLATGDAVNVAARLEQAAEPGEVLIGAETLALVAAVVEAGEERALEFKGKSEPVAAYPLVAVREAAERSHASRFVGRVRELEQLTDAWGRALAGPRCELVTVVGDPGVGKSRLVAEALEQIDARVVRSGCLSYGEGITYWPVVEVVKQLEALPSDEAAAIAIRSLLGENDAGSDTEEIAGRSASCSPRRRLSSSSSTTSSGPRRRSSSSSKRPRSFPPARRSCCSVWRDRSCSTAARAGRPCCGWSPFPRAKPVLSSATTSRTRCVSGLSALRAATRSS